MIKITLILLLIHYIGLYLFKPKHDTLSCGIFGWAGKNVKTFNKDKFDKLGILNVERGKSSCGITFDGDIHIGLDSNKLYYDFIQDRDIIIKRFPIVIGHTRQSSVGVVNYDNAHPFGFGSTQSNDYEFIGCHNGTLKNHIELSKKYKIEDKVNSTYTNQYGVTIDVTRNKIDSEILLEILYNQQNFKVLSEYIGGASIVFTDTTKPNVIYLFKGASKDWKHSQVETVERPMFVYVENKNSMYFSSLEESLKTIGGRDNTIFDTKANVVYKITDGDFANSEQIEVSRINSTQNETIVNYHTQNYQNAKRFYGHEHFDEWDNFNDGYGTAKKEIEVEQHSQIMRIVSPLLLNIKKEEEINNIYCENTVQPLASYKDRVYFRNLRYLRNGHFITGIYCYIPKYGYWFLSNDAKKAEDIFWNLLDKVFDGKTFYSEDAFNQGQIPFKSEDQIVPCYYYFVEGVQIKTYLDYCCFYKEYSSLRGNQLLSYIKLSHVSTHPIIDISDKEGHLNSSINKQCIVKDGTYFNGISTPLGAERIYNIKTGNLLKYESSVYFENLIDVEFYSKNCKKLDDVEKTIKLDFPEFFEDELSEDDELMTLIEQEEELNQIVQDICNESFVESIKDFQNLRQKLIRHYMDNNNAVKVISFIDNSLKSIKQFIN